MLQTANSEHITDYGTVNTSIAQCEYIIYAYDLFENDKIGCNKWRRVTSGSDLDRITQRALELYSTGEFQRVEIKKKSYNTKKQTNQVATYKTYGNRSNRNFTTLVAIFALSLSVLGLFYLNFM